jgi:2-hydroxycyclohexanecarboxyl-CoA dehydrogenase
LRTAVITGSARGIGKAIALQLARDGFSIAVVDIRADQGTETTKEIQASGAKAIAMQVDITQSTSVEESVRGIASELGPPAVLVNCAGWDEAKPFLESDEDIWKRIVDINYLGALRMTHAILPYMVEQRFGRLVNIGSDAARVGSASEAVYSGAKGALVSFTKAIAREVARYEITANSVCPGPTRSPLLLETLEVSEEANRVLEGMQRAIPLRRIAEPEDIAGAVAYFASPAAAYVTGQTLSVSGGLTMA